MDLQDSTRAMQIHACLRWPNALIVHLWPHAWQKRSLSGLSASIFTIFSGCKDQKHHPWLKFPSQKPKKRFHPFLGPYRTSWRDLCLSWLCKFWAPSCRFFPVQSPRSMILYLSGSFTHNNNFPQSLLNGKHQIWIVPYYMLPNRPINCDIDLNPNHLLSVEQYSLKARALRFAPMHLHFTTTEV